MENPDQYAGKAISSILKVSHEILWDVKLVATTITVVKMTNILISINF